VVLAPYIDPDFLARDTCLRIRQAMDAGQPESAEVLHDTIEHRDEVRRASYVEVDAVVLHDVEARLDARRSDIGAFFGIALSAREGAGFVRYPDGGFYRPHRDRANVPSWPEAARRRIAVVVFLNSSRESDPHGGFAGGVLRLLEGEARLAPKAGMLVAFPADVLHEVTMVRDGTRDAIVDWFY
jgi:predicted 2-oxoglutarate/Fe(II)-dependent dioxygenase YbiX